MKAIEKDGKKIVIYKFDNLPINDFMVVQTKSHFVLYDKQSKDILI